MKCLLLIAFFLCLKPVFADAVFIPMDDQQTNHLKAYGIVFRQLQQKHAVEWLLNFRGGSFLFPQGGVDEQELVASGVSYLVLSEETENVTRALATHTGFNTRIVQLESVPRIAVYVPVGAPSWDSDPVTGLLQYAGIPYETIGDSAVLTGALTRYDWLHVHDEDFTGQYGKLYNAYRNERWYCDQATQAEVLAAQAGYAKVAQLKLAVAEKMRSFVEAGGFLFAMCGATDSYDIALSARNTDICEWMYDMDKSDSLCQQKLDFGRTLAFTDFQVVRDPLSYEYASIDGTMLHRQQQSRDTFALRSFPAYCDSVPTMLTQCHTQTIRGFMGLTTDFKANQIKRGVLILGESPDLKTARYIHGNLGKGSWTFYGGHDPEDYQRRIGDPPADPGKHPNSPGYRLILNNVLFRAVK